IVHRYLPLDEVGILSVYQGGSIQMAYFFTAIAAQVFFPIASRTPNRSVVFTKLNRMMLITSLPFTILYIGILTLYLGVLGKHYPLQSPLLAIFSAAAVMTTFFGLVTWFLASEGHRGLVVSSLTGLVAGGLNLFLCRELIPNWGVAGAGLAQGI